MKKETENANMLAFEIWIGCKKWKGDNISTVAMKKITRTALAAIKCKVVKSAPLTERQRGET